MSAGQRAALLMFAALLTYSFFHQKNNNMNLLDLAEKAKQHYDATINDNVVSGSTLYILTDGNRCLIVDQSYNPNPAGTIFKCYRRNGQTVVEAQ